MVGILGGRMVLHGDGVNMFGLWSDTLGSLRKYDIVLFEYCITGNIILSSSRRKDSGRKLRHDMVTEANNTTRLRLCKAFISLSSIWFHLPELSFEEPAGFVCEQLAQGFLSILNVPNQ